MFLTDCQACGLRELRGARSIETLVDTRSGPALVYRCTRCQAPNLLEGNPAVSEPLRPVPVPAAPAHVAA